MDKIASSTGEAPAAATSAVPLARWLLVMAVAFSAGTCGGVIYYVQQSRPSTPSSSPRDWTSVEVPAHSEDEGKHSTHIVENPQTDKQGLHFPVEPAPTTIDPLKPSSPIKNEMGKNEAGESKTSQHGPAEDPAAALNAPPPTSMDLLPELDPVSPIDKLTRADALFLEGSYGRARDEYATLSLKAQGVHEAQLRLRLGICEELLGNHHQSQLEYQRVAELKPGTALQEAALLGQARVWKQTGRTELAAAILLQAVLEGSYRGSTGRSEIPHQLALLMAEFIRPLGMATANSNDSLSDAVLLTPSLHSDPRSILAAINTPEPAAIADPKLDTAEEITLIQRFSTSPEEIFLSVHTPRLSAVELIRRVCNKCGWEVRLTDQARLRLQERTVQPDAVNLPLALVLDALLTPFELIWETQENAVLIYPANQAGVEQMSRYRLASANRALRFACTYSSHHPWAVASALELGRVAAYRGEPEAGIRNIRKAIEQFPRSDFLAVGWFNLGKLELQMGRHEESLQAFYRAADLLSAQSLEPVSYLYVGRLHLERELPREAISPLTRALVLAEGTPYESMAALQLASAYLMLQHYQRANEILMEHRSSFKVPSRHDQAAFLCSLIRYRAAVDETDRFREGATLIGTLTNLNVKDCFGGHWWYLAGLAYRDVGMRGQEVETFKKCLAGSYEFALQEQLRLLLLEDAPDQISASGLQTRTGGNSADEFHAKAMMIEAAELFRNGSDAEALGMCRQLLERPNVPEPMRREALRLMGQIYQARGEHNLAVECFTGLIPSPSSSNSESSAGHLPLGDVQ